MRRDTDAGVQSTFRRRLRRCAEVLEETVGLYGDQPAAIDDGFVSTVMVAAGAIRAAADAAADPARATALEVAARVAHEAAAAIRAYGLDRQLLRAAEACERAARLCSGG